MNTFSYYATFDESLAMLADLCAAGLRVVPNRRYERNEAPAYDHVTDDLVAVLKEGPAFLLAGPYSRFPPQLKRLDRGPAEGSWVIDFMCQGPMLEGMLGRANVVDGVLRLLPGDLGHQPRYTNPETGRRENIAADLKTAYKRAIVTMQRRLVVHPITNLPIGPAAVALAQAGAAIGVR